MARNTRSVGTRIRGKGGLAVLLVLALALVFPALALAHLYEFSGHTEDMKGQVDLNIRGRQADNGNWDAKVTHFEVTNVKFTCSDGNSFRNFFSYDGYMQSQGLPKLANDGEFSFNYQAPSANANPDRGGFIIKRAALHGKVNDRATHAAGQLRIVEASGPITCDTGAVRWGANAS